MDWIFATDCLARNRSHQGRSGGVTLVPGEDGTLKIRGFVDGAELVLRK